MRTYLRALIVVCCCWMTSGFVQAQDLHYSQFYNSPLNLNPALAGIFNGDLRFMGNYRNQWASVPVDYTTFTGSFDTRFSIDKSSENFLNVGAIFNFDQAGDSDLGLAQLGLNLGYTFVVNENNLFTPAFQVTFQQHSFSFANLRPVNIPENNLSDNTTDFDLAAGFNWRTQQSDRTKFDFGASLFHILTPNQSFYAENDESRDLRFSVYGIGSTEISEKADFMVRALGQFQGENEILVGGAIKYYLSKKRGNQVAVEGGGSYRFGDAIFPNVTLYYNQLMVGFSYDINISDFETATSNKGGPELAISYIIRRVRPLKRFKNCPIF